MYMREVPGSNHSRIASRCTNCRNAAAGTIARSCGLDKDYSYACVATIYVLPAARRIPVCVVRTTEDSWALEVISI